MEDDTLMTWNSLLSWALDTIVLEKFGFLRCIVRTEISSKDGNMVLFDWEYEIEYKNAKKLILTDYRSLSPTCSHTNFVSPDFPFQGLWIATRPQLKVFMNHPYWTKTGSLNSKQQFVDLFGYPEKSNSLNIMINVPSGYRSTCMVPVINRTISPLAFVSHMRNAYSDYSPNPRLSSVNANHAIF